MAKHPVLISAEHIGKIYQRGSEEVRALNGISLEVREGEFVSFIGPSGSGKTTLVNILGCLDNPTSGRLHIGGREVFGGSRELSETELTRVRREHFGYIFQNFHLIPTLTVLENTMLPFTFYRNKEGQSDVTAILEELGLGQRLQHLPVQLSGGEMQRVAIARALANRPRILLADEPTGNLDAKRSKEIGSILSELNKKDGLTIIMVTHNTELSQAAHRRVHIRDGVLQ